jgi:chaperonin cofactor prefoldin
MYTYYSKKEYNEMKRSLEKKILMLERQNKRLSDKLKKLNKKDVAD